MSGIRSVITDDPLGRSVPKETYRLVGRRQQLLTSLAEDYGFEDEDIRLVSQIWEQATQNVENRLSSVPLVLSPGTHTSFATVTPTPTRTRATAQEIKTEFESLISSRSEEAAERIRIGLAVPGDTRMVSVSSKVDDLMEGLPMARDGQYVLTTGGLRDIRRGFSEMLEELQGRSTGRILTFQESDTVKKLQQQINAIDTALKKANEGDVIARVNLGFGQIKGEAFIMSDRMAERYRDPVTGLIPRVVTDITNVKGEVGSNIVRNILLDVGDEDPEVFSDPLMFLYHEEYFAQPAFRTTMQRNAAAGIANISQFSETADIPSDVLRQLEMDLANEINTVVPSTRHAVAVERLDPVFRAADFRRRREAEEIVLALRSGEDPRNIPALVRRVSDHHASKVVRYNSGRADVVMPSARRFALRTFESLGDSGYGFEGSVRHGVNLAHYGFGGPIRSHAGTLTDEIQFVQFRIRGKDMMLAGRAARLYKNALGGFDLDDKGIPLMSTFVDSRNKKRLAFYTLRQPTSFQESIATVADLTDEHTIRALFNKKNSTKLVDALHDDALIGSLGYTTSNNAVRRLRQIIPAEGRAGRTQKISATLASEMETLLIQLIESDRVHGAELPGLTASQVAQMLMTQDASALGLSSTVRSGSRLFELMRDAGLNPSTDPTPYASDTVFQIFRQKAESDLNSKIVSAVSAELRMDFGTDIAAATAEIQGLIGRTGPRYAQGMEHRVSAAILTTLEDVQRAAAETTVEESIGLFVNRQGSAIYTIQHSRRVMEQLGGTAEDVDILRKASTIFTLPASEAVDFSKQISLEQFLSTQGQALARINREMGIDSESVLEVMTAYFQQIATRDGSPMPSESEIRAMLAGLSTGAAAPPLSLDAVGKQMLKSFRAVGVTRAKQIADQVAATGTVDKTELYGLQRTLFEGDYARISSYGVDQTQSVNEVLAGLKQYLDERTGLTTDQRNAIQEHINELETLRTTGSTEARGATQRVLEGLYMTEGTPAYRRFADLGQQNSQFQQILATAEVEKSKAIAAARERSTQPIATVKSRFRTESKNIVSSIKEEIKVIKEKSSAIRAAGTEQAVSEIFSLRQARITAAGKVFEGLSASRAAAHAAGETFGGKETLDVVESVLANLMRELPEQEANKLFGDIADESGDITVVNELFASARRRMLGRTQAARTDMAMALDPRIQSAFDFASDSRSLLGQAVRTEVGSYLPGNIEDITQEQAAGIVKGIRRYRKASGTGIDPAENEALTILSELMGQRKRGSALFSADELARVTPQAENAYRYYFGGRKIVEAEEAAAGAIASTRLLGTGGRPVAPTAVDAIRTAVDDVIGSGPVRTNYKRFRESLKSGALGEAIKNPIVKTGLIAAAALSAFGFIHASRKDHTESDIAGPPLLPGGSAYEQGYPTNMAQPSTERYQGQSASGTQYRVYTTGSQDDSERLSSILGGVVDGPINSTMYNSLPQLGRDPYSSVASSF